MVEAGYAGDNGVDGGATKRVISARVVEDQMS
jgi:hypothetical protein